MSYILPAADPASIHKRRFPTLRTITALMLREMSSRYGRTPGGFVWSILEPLAGIVVLSFGFSLLLRQPSLGTSFLLFYATGYLPFTLYVKLSGAVARSLTFSKSLLKFPAVSWIDAVLARFILNSLFGILVSIILLTGILSMIENRAVLDFPPIIVANLVAMLLGAGVGTVNCVLFNLYPVWELIWGIITRPLFLASGIFYVYEDLPTVAQEILWWNPLFHMTGVMRTGFYPTYTASFVNLTYVTMFGMILLAFGVLLTRRYHREIINL